MSLAEMREGGEPLGWRNAVADSSFCEQTEVLEEVRRQDAARAISWPTVARQTKEEKKFLV
jgi:hypothetical protein